MGCRGKKRKKKKKNLFPPCFLLLPKSGGVGQDRKVIACTYEFDELNTTEKEEHQ